MESAELIIDYKEVEKPVRLVRRSSGLGGTDYYFIARITKEDADLLARAGISWLYGEPDPQEFYDKIQLMKAEKDLKNAQDQVAKLSKPKAAQ